jgi:hypothetical protein
MARLARRLGFAAIILTFGALAPGGALAAAPSNDTYKTATPITSLPFTEPIDLTEATDDPGLPPCEAGVSRRIWYTYTPPTNQTIRVSVGGNDAAELALWKVVSGGPKGIDLIGCGVFGRDLAATLVAGTKYAISVGQAVGGPYLIATLTVAVLPPPANDNFADAKVISSSPYRDVFNDVDTASATLEVGEPTGSCLLAGQQKQSLWYRIAAPVGATVSADVFTLGAFVVWQGTTLSGLSQVACHNQGDVATFGVESSTPYFIQVLAAPERETIVSVTFTANDDFADAIALVDLPASQSIDLTGATVEAGEPVPTCIGDRTQTAWWSFTPTADGVIRGEGRGFLAAYTGSALADLTEIGCGYYGQMIEIPVIAGQTVYLQIGFPSQQPGEGGLTLDFAPAPPNDDFSDATSISVGSVIPADLSAASVERGEAAPSCGSTPAKSVWYSLTGDGSPISLSLDPGSYGFAVAAYTGSSLGSLSELACRAFDGAPLTTRFPAGTVVHIQLWVSDVFFNTQATALRVETAPAPTAAFGWYVGDPSIFDDVFFVDQSTDPGGNPVTSWSWDFGDGSTSTNQYPSHRFAADGDYTVKLTVETSDGRRASTSQTVAVRTHDVGIAKFMVPTTAKAGQSKQISVGIANRRYPESVTVQLLVSRGGGSWQEVGVVTRSVPVLGANQTVDFAFNYTFTKADATAGKVTFRAIASLNSARDALPTDNEAISLATKVSR